MGAAGLLCTAILLCEYRQNPASAKTTPIVMRAVKMLLSPVQQEQVLQRLMLVEWLPTRQEAGGFKVLHRYRQVSTLG